MFWTRLASGVVLIIVALLTIITGGTVLDVTLWIISCIGFRELVNAFGVHGKHTVQAVSDAADGDEKGKAEIVPEKWNPLEAVGYLGITAWYLCLHFGRMSGWNLFLTELLIILIVFFGEMFLYVFLFPRYRAEQITAVFFSFLYAPVMLSFIGQTRALALGKYTVWLIFISAWGCDTCAYCTGVLFGKHKMSPILSPKKSIEGAIGGVVGASVLGALYAVLVLERVRPEQHAALLFGVLSAVGALISMVGDLAASAIKRDHGIKDYGRLIPGHGGIMDRFDSVIFTSPAIYFLAVLFFHAG